MESQPLSGLPRQTLCSIVFFPVPPLPCEHTPLSSFIHNAHPQLHYVECGFLPAMFTLDQGNSFQQLGLNSTNGGYISGIILGREGKRRCVTVFPGHTVCWPEHRLRHRVFSAGVSLPWCELLCQTCGMAGGVITGMHVGLLAQMCGEPVRRKAGSTIPPASISNYSTFCHCRYVWAGGNSIVFH